MEAPSEEKRLEEIAKQTAKICKETRLRRTISQGRERLTSDEDMPIPRSSRSETNNRTSGYLPPQRSRSEHRRGNNDAAPSIEEMRDMRMTLPKAIARTDNREEHFVDQKI